ncbi:hypothetical protein HA050_16390 [Iodobacter sp. HSC-16F04]|uniref:HEPN domain-containing protein n=1 Tax=Iodobacter violaceini TaxID=3044271 RepID=A0ABX0KYY5_9NEIS|nr:hypothetical protein [Iodobacter violacea]NHQ87697.1 hypothetical protein [Iodobacter violacea]
MGANMGSSSTTEKTGRPHSPALGTMTPEQRIARLKRLVSAARALLSFEVGMAHGAHRVVNALYHLGPEFKDSHKVFRQFIEAIPLDIPFGPPRLYMEHKYLLKTDKVLAKIESKYRELILVECMEVIAKYG